jgi:drug/metabolite transporter (DMT)-like permease
MKIFYSILLFLLYALSSGSGLILLKRAVSGVKIEYSIKGILNIISLELVIGFILYAIGFVCWMVILSKMKLNIAFPVAMSLFFIVSALGSYFILKEPFTPKIIIGIVVCLIGIILVTIK